MPRRRLYSQPVLIGADRVDGRPTRLYPDPIHDAEAFCTRYLDEALEQWGMYLRAEDYEDSIQELIRHLLRLEQRFDPERNDSFANYARSILPKRAVDAGPRRILGRTGNRVHDYLHDELDESAAGHQPGQDQPTEQGHSDPDRGSDAGGLQTDRDRRRAWAKTVLGVGAA